MDYELENLSWWQYFLGIPAMVFLYFAIGYFKNLNSNDFLIQSGFLIFLLGILYDRIKSRKENNELKGLLILEIRRNITSINENMIRINDFKKNKAPLKSFSYLENPIIMSILNSGKLTILPAKILNTLFNFNSIVIMINKKLNKGFTTKSLMSDTTVPEHMNNAKRYLKTILIVLDKSELYEAVKLKGRTQSLEKEYILTDDIKL